MKTIFTGLVIVSVFLLNISAICAQDSDKIVSEESLKPQTECPVQGGPVDKELYADCNGKRIYVCCEGCIETIKADPEKYLKILADKGEEAENIPEN